MRRYFQQLPEQIERKLLRGAARAAADVVAAEAKERSISTEVAEAVNVSRPKLEPDRITIKVRVSGPGAYIAPWLEYGTAPHLISVDERQRGGRTVNRINKLAREEGSSHSLVIGGKFVGRTIMHPGATPHPFLRPALDAKEREAIAAAQAFISSHVVAGRIVGAEQAQEAE